MKRWSKIIRGRGNDQKAQSNRVNRYNRGKRVFVRWTPLAAAPDRNRPQVRNGRDLQPQHPLLQNAPHQHIESQDTPNLHRYSAIACYCAAIDNIGEMFTASYDINYKLLFFFMFFCGFLNTLLCHYFNQYISYYYCCYY